MYVFKNSDQYESVINVYNTRNTSSLQIRFERLALCRKLIYHNVPSFFNSAPPEYSSLQSLNYFKIEIQNISFVHVDKLLSSIVLFGCSF